MRIVLDEEKCIGCGLCEELLPEVFAVGKFHTRIKRQEIGPGMEEAALAAAQDCPVSAISFQEDEPA